LFKITGVSSLSAVFTKSMEPEQSNPFTPQHLSPLHCRPYPPQPKPSGP
jgi:hypothetical protein